MGIGNNVNSKVEAQLEVEDKFPVGKKLQVVFPVGTPFVLHPGNNETLILRGLLEGIDIGNGYKNWVRIYFDRAKGIPDIILETEEKYEKFLETVWPEEGVVIEDYKDGNPHSQVIWKRPTVEEAEEVLTQIWAGRNQKIKETLIDLGLEEGRVKQLPYPEFTLEGEFGVLATQIEVCMSESGYKFLVANQIGNGLQAVICCKEKEGQYQDLDKKWYRDPVKGETTKWVIKPPTTRARGNNIKVDNPLIVKPRNRRGK